MKILVLYTAVSPGGGAVILEQYYKKATQDLDNHWTFLIGNYELKERMNISVMKYGWVKKNWINRLFFDKVTIFRVLKRTRPDRIISLQNIGVSSSKIPQTIYLHQLIPFSDVKFSIRQTRLLVYQNIIGKLIIKSLKKADKIIVQTVFLKKILVNRLSITQDKIEVQRPDVEYIKMSIKRTDYEKTVLFYPAAPYYYKNHQFIVKALTKLSKEVLSKVEVIFTFNGEENKYAYLIKKDATKKRLPIKFIGQISRQSVFEYYHNSILLFPSLIESYGLPLEEAKICGASIVAIDLDYSREVLQEYNNVLYFDSKDVYSLASNIETIVTMNEKNRNM